MKNEEVTKLKEEIERLTSIREILENSLTPIEEIFIDLDFDGSCLAKFVTRIRMDSRCAFLALGSGKKIELRATTQENLDEAILFGNGIDSPLGIVNAAGVLKVHPVPLGPSYDDLALMTERALSLSTSRWIVNSQREDIIEALSNLCIDLPVVLIDNKILKGRDFLVGLFSLQYYVLGEYGGGGGVMIDGQPLLQYAADGPYSPFIICERPEGI